MARSLPSILPRLSLDEALDITRIYSVTGQLPTDTPLVNQRPFRASHHTISNAGLVGGGRLPRPGEISLAHRGVLFLDELPEFGPKNLETLRQPLEDKVVTISRARKTYAIMSFFRFHHHHGVIATNAAATLIPPRPMRPEPRFLSEEEYQRLLRVCSQDPRDAAIVEVLLQTGMRLSELARLTVNDVELPRRINREPDNTGSVRIRRKGGKEATIPLNRFARLARRWLRG